MTALPLGLVILLCVLMMGWTSHSLWHSATAAITPIEPSSGVLAAQAATIPSEEAKANAVALPQQAPAATEAAFERMHISHARINVPH